MSSIIRHLSLPKDVLGIICEYYWKWLRTVIMKRMNKEYKRFIYENSGGYNFRMLENPTFNKYLLDSYAGCSVFRIVSGRSGYVKVADLPRNYRYSGGESVIYIFN